MKSFDQFFKEHAEKQAFRVTNVYVRGSRVDGETTASSDKAALINVIIRNLTPEQQRNPREYIHKAIEVGGYKIEPILRLDPKWAAQRAMTMKVWGPLLQQHVAKGLKTETGYPVAPEKSRQTFGGMENWKGIIVWMSPDKFLSLATRLNDNEYDEHNIARLIKHIQSGKTLDPLYLKVEDHGVDRLEVTGHEGRHRAAAAKILGFDKVPVLIYPYNWPRVPEWTPAMRRTIEAADFTPESR